MKKTIFTILVSLATFSIVCYGGQIYEDARQAGIELYNRGQYQLAAKQFIATQNIAPVNNDLSSWITKCNNKMVQSRNAKIKKRKAINTQNTMQSAGQKIQRYDSIGKYGTANLALVKYENKYGFIDRDSVIVVPIQYDDVYSIIMDVIPGTHTDEILKQYNMKWTWSWDKGELMSVNKDGKWGYINECGKEVVPVIYDDVESIARRFNSLIVVGNDGQYGYIDKEGTEIIPLVYDYAGWFKEEFDVDGSTQMMAAVVKNGSLGYINPNGNTIIDFIYEPIYNLDYNIPQLIRPVWFDGMTIQKRNGKYGIINLKGENVTDFKYDTKIEQNAIPIGEGYLNDPTYPYFKFKLGLDTITYFQGNEYFNENTFNKKILEERIKCGNKSSIFELALYYWNTGNYNKSSKLAEKGDKVGHIGCSRLLGAYWLFYTDTPSMAAPYLTKAAEQDDDIAQYLLGLMYEEDLIMGNGQKNDKNRNFFNRLEAIDWYKKSAKNGNQQAIERLKTLGIKYNKGTN